MDASERCYIGSDRDGGTAPGHVLRVQRLRPIPDLGLKIASTRARRSSRRWPAGRRVGRERPARLLKNDALEGDHRVRVPVVLEERVDARPVDGLVRQLGEQHAPRSEDRVDRSTWATPARAAIAAMPTSGRAFVEEAPPGSASRIRRRGGLAPTRRAAAECTGGPCDK